MNKYLPVFMLVMSLLLASCGKDETEEQEGSDRPTTTTTPDNTPGAPSHYLLNGVCYVTATNQPADSLSCPSPQSYVSLDGTCYETTNNTVVNPSFCAQIPPSGNGTYYWINGSCYNSIGINVSSNLCPGATSYYWSGSTCLSSPGGQPVSATLCPAATEYFIIGGTCYGIPGNQIVDMSLCNGNMQVSYYYIGYDQQCYESPSGAVVDMSFCGGPQITYSWVAGFCFSSNNELVSPSFCQNSSGNTCEGTYYTFHPFWLTLVPIQCDASNSCSGQTLFDQNLQQITCQ